MKVDGLVSLRVARAQLWEALTAPATAQRCLPGCEVMEPDPGGPEGTFRVVVKMGVAAVRGTYTGTVRLTDLRPPEGYRLEIDVKGALGHVATQVDFVLRESAAGTDVAYAASAELHGMVMAVGHRMLTGIGRMVMDQFLHAVEREVAARTTARLHDEGRTPV